MKTITGRSKGRSVLVGELERDSKGWPDYIQIGGMFVKFWIWDELAKWEEFPSGSKVRITIEVIE